MTIKEIAQLSGVSISTVSKIMNHKDEHISPETRDKVLSIAKEYNYSPYAFARNTSISKSFLLGVLLRSEPNYGKLLDGIRCWFLYFQARSCSCINRPNLP